MSSLKEQREKLLQAKIKEMANIGVKKRTAENTPEFDEPINLEDSWTSTEGNNDTSKIKKTSLLDDREQILSLSSKLKESPKSKKYFKIARDFEEYEQRFLTTIRNGRNKSGFSIHTEVLQLLRNVISDLRIETSITEYIENILLDHFKTYQELLNHTASQRKRKKTIDL